MRDRIIKRSRVVGTMSNDEVRMMKMIARAGCRGPCESVVAAPLCRRSPKRYRAARNCLNIRGICAAPNAFSRLFTPSYGGGGKWGLFTTETQRGGEDQESDSLPQKRTKSSKRPVSPLAPTYARLRPL